MNPIFMYVVLTVIAVASVVSMILVCVTGARLKGLVDQVDGVARLLETRGPKIARVIDDVEREVAALRGIGGKARSLVGSAESMTTTLLDAVHPVLTEVSHIARVVRHVRAARLAVRAGAASVWGRRHANGKTAEYA
jgi:hypothetical protein